MDAETLWHILNDPTFQSVDTSTQPDVETADTGDWLGMFSYAQT